MAGLDVGGVVVNRGLANEAKYGPGKSANHSPLMKALASSDGSPVNMCPFGCDDDDLDEQGYCHHLIGFSPDGKTLERTEMHADGRRRTHCPIQSVKGKMRFVPEPLDKAKVKAGEIRLERITTSFRVYENVPRPDGLPEPEADELTDDELDALTDPEGDE